MWWFLGLQDLIMPNVGSLRVTCRLSSVRYWGIVKSFYVLWDKFESSNITGPTLLTRLPGWETDIVLDYQSTIAMYNHTAICLGKGPNVNVPTRQGKVHQIMTELNRILRRITEDDLDSKTFCSIFRSIYWIKVYPQNFTTSSFGGCLNLKRICFQVPR